MIREQLIPWMDKYIIMDDVTLSDETERWGTLALEGPKAAAVVREISGVDIAQQGELVSVDGTFGTIPCRIVKRSPGDIPGAEFVVERAHLPSLWQTLLDAARKHGGGPAGYTALSAQRLAQGVPWFGYDFGEKQIPHEAGLENSHISYTKGCYTGQEIVERVRSRGQVNRLRVLLRFHAAEVPASGTSLLAEGKEVGHLTRTAFSPALEAPIGMGYVRRENSSLGSELALPSGKAFVIAPPNPRA